MTGPEGVAARPVFLATGADVTGAEPVAGEGTLANCPWSGAGSGRTVSSSLRTVATPQEVIRANAVMAPTVTWRATGAGR